jgi:hypothetical protein|tara:strand:+ start:292 stop:747 length:456 start_codon:yes stop_codon:yes gene_type:complete
LKHKNHKLESKALYEIIRQFDHHIEVPHSIQHGDYNKFLTSFDGIKQIVKKYNDSSDSKEQLLHLTSLSTHLLRLVDEMLEDHTKIKYSHALNIKKKNYIIDGFRKYIASKEELDAEIPSDDEEPTKGGSAPKIKGIKGLSKAERQVLGIK